MKYIILFLVCIPLITAQNINGSFNITTDNITITVDVNTLISTTINHREQICQPLGIEGISSISLSGEKIQYYFTNFQEGDEITYWIEDAQGEIIKDAYTTTNNNKKSYTPNIQEKEKAIFIKAERSRDDCNKSSAEEVIIILGETTEEASEEIICEYEQPTTSFYVRATKYAEEINLYGKTTLEGNYILFGEKQPRTITLQPGSFQLVIKPEKFNNTFAIIQEEYVKQTNFYLEAEEETTEEIIIEEIKEENNTIPSNFTFAATGNVVLENNSKNNTTLLLAITGLTGLTVGVSSFKTKVLRRKHDSA